MGHDQTWSVLHAFSKSGPGDLGLSSGLFREWMQVLGFLNILYATEVCKLAHSLF